jgi:hypothetical protein
MLRFLHVFTAVAALLAAYVLFLFFMGWFDFNLAKGSITTLDATYGQNCGAGFGNATGHVIQLRSRQADAESVTAPGSEWQDVDLELHARLNPPDSGATS